MAVWEVRVVLAAVAHNDQVQLVDLELLVKDIPVALAIQMQAEIPGAGAVALVPLGRRGLHLAQEVLGELVYNGVIVIIMQAVAVLVDKVQAVLVAVEAEAMAVSGRGLSRQLTEHCILGAVVAAV
jgi:hypothetical protein